MSAAFTESTMADPPREAFFQVKPIPSATYATYTVTGSGNKRSHDCAVYRLEFAGRRDDVRIEDAVYKDVPHFLFKRGVLNVASSSKFESGANWPYSAGGAMPVLWEIVKRGHPIGGWGPRWPKRHPVLLFAAFELGGMNLRQGETREVTAMPFILQDSIGNTMLSGEIVPRDLPPTRIRSRWTDCETVDGYPCAVIEFSLKAQAIKERAVGQEAGEYRLTGKSYFCVELGLPVVNSMEASGFTVNKNGRKKDIAMKRREVLICVSRARKAEYDSVD
jgi:hypothetical protein